MPTNHYAVAAVPATGATALLRSGLVGRYAYCLSNGESASDFIAIDPETGDVCPALIQNGALYGLDNADTTTASGPTCLVSYDSKRYKLNSLTTPFSVLSKGLTAPPESPTIGNAYLLYGTPSGAWAGKLGQIAIYTSRGWEFMPAQIGFRVYVEDEDAFYYRDTVGDWQAGLGAVLLPDASVAPSMLIWDNRVENQTTNSPPASWSKGVAYIIGASASGDWLGQTGNIALAESNGVLADGDKFTIYPPHIGQVVFDKSLGIDIRWNGSAWISAAGVWVNEKDVFTATGSTTRAGSGIYAASAVTAPKRSQAGMEDDAIISFAAKRSGARLRFSYDALISLNSDGFGLITMALFRDNETDAIAWKVAPRTGAGRVDASFFLVVTAADDSAHNYRIKIMDAGTVEYCDGITRRTFMVEELA